MALHNQAVTGSAVTLPYQLSRAQYGVPTTFTFQPLPDAATAPDPGAATRLSRYSPSFTATGRRRSGPISLASPAGSVTSGFTFCRRSISACRSSCCSSTGSVSRGRQRLSACSCSATNAYPYFYTHYIAAVSCLLVLAGVAGLERLSRIRVRGVPAGDQAARLIVCLCAAHFLFWYGLHLFAGEETVQAVSQYETWDAINHGDPDGRIEIRHRLEQAPGTQLVFVRYGPRHTFKEWVHNEAAIDEAKIVWSRDLGPAENEKLRHYYPERTAWLLEPDARPWSLLKYEP